MMASPNSGSPLEAALVFLRLGSLSFGGPVAHLGYFHEAFVVRRRWLDESEYADIVALCQFLPGPASSQVAFAIGLRRAGLRGAVAASIAFLAPSAVLMIAAAYGLATLPELAHAGWVHGLKLAAVGVVGQAVWTMGRRLCPDVPRAGLAALAALVCLLGPGAWTQVATIAGGGALGWIGFRHMFADDSAPAAARTNHRASAVSLATFVALLAVLPALASGTGWRSLQVFDGFYRAGSLVFGGGHVVLPLLRAEVVPSGLVQPDAFLAGYGAAQAVPGPLFSFAGYLGTLIFPGPGAWLGGVWCLVAVFLPSWLVVGGTLPFWHRARSRPWAQAIARGANASVVGVLFAALCTPVASEAFRSLGDVAIAALAFGLLQLARTPAIAVVVACAVLGAWAVR